MTDKNTFVLQSCTDVPGVEHGLCSDTSVQSSGDGNEVVCIKIEGLEVHIKEEDDPIAISFSSVSDSTDFSAVSRITTCNGDVLSVCLSS